MTKKRKQSAASGGEEIIGLAAGLFGGYIAAEALLSAYSHYYHWIAAAFTTLAGYFGVLVWYKVGRAWYQAHRQTQTPVPAPKPRRRR